MKSGTATGPRAGQHRPAPLSPRATLRWDVVRRTVERLTPGSILEIGCGMGGMGVRLASLAEYTAVEPDERSFTAAHERITPLGGTVIHGDHTVVPAGTQYDLVCAFEVLEHISDDHQALTQWLPFIKPGGHLLLSVPADPRRFGPSDVLVRHYRRYTAEQLLERLTAVGAAQSTVTHYAWPLGYILDSIRNGVADHHTGQVEDQSLEQRSSGSGRFLQPTGRLAGLGITLAVSPWILLQRLRPGRGPGLVAVATRPRTEPVA